MPRTQGEPIEDVLSQDEMEGLVSEVTEASFELMKQGAKAYLTEAEIERCQDEQTLVRMVADHVGIDIREIDNGPQSDS